MPPLSAVQPNPAQANPQRGTENTSPLPNPWAPTGQSPAPATPRAAPTTTPPVTAPNPTSPTGQRFVCTYNIIFILNQQRRFGSKLPA